MALRPHYISESTDVRDEGLSNDLVATLALTLTVTLIVLLQQEGDAWGEGSSNDLVAMGGGGGVAAAPLPSPPTQQQILEATLPLTAAAGGAAGALGDGMPAQGPPSRHLWVGNMPVKPNKAAIEAAFASFGPVESVRVPCDMSRCKRVVTW